MTASGRGRLSRLACLVAMGTAMVAPPLATALGPERPASSAAGITGVVRGLGGSRVPALLFVPSLPSEAAPETAFVDQRRLEYVPAVQLVEPGTPVLFRNSDPLVHNVFSPTRETGRFDVGRYGPDAVRVHTFTTPGAALILCRIHPEMFAYVVVASAATWTLTGRDGRFQLDNVPPGTTELILWHVRSGMQRVGVTPGSAGPITVVLSGG